MTGRLDNLARRLAANDSRRKATVTLVDESGDGITRRDALKTGVGVGVAFGAMSAFGPSLGSAEADDYCFGRCVHDAENNLARKNDIARSTILALAPGLLIPGVNTGILGGTAYDVLNNYSDFYQDRAHCRSAGCGDPSRFPPPAAPPVTPAPVKPPGCDAGYVLCGDYCCDSSLAFCQGCSAGPVCCRNGSNCCPNG